MHVTRKSAHIDLAEADADRGNLYFREYLQVRVLYFVGRALLKEDRPTFALHLVHGMNPHLFQPVRAPIS